MLLNICEYLRIVRRNTNENPGLAESANLNLTRYVAYFNRRRKHFINRKQLFISILSSSERKKNPNLRCPEFLLASAGSIMCSESTMNGRPYYKCLSLEAPIMHSLSNKAFVIRLFISSVRLAVENKAYKMRQSASLQNDIFRGIHVTHQFIDKNK